jgi:hypothetical protein
MKEKHKKAAAVGSASAAAAFVEELPEGPHIAKVMACFNEYFGSGSTEATENYSFLSEFCHPNSFAFTNHLEVEDPRAGTNSAKVTFIRPGRDVCIQVMPGVLYACMPVLFSMDALLRRIGDGGLSKAAYEYGAIAGPAEAAEKK